MRRIALLVALATLLLPASGGGAAGEFDARRDAGSADARGCRAKLESGRSWPGWLRPRRVTVLVDSVLLGGVRALRGRRRCWRVAVHGRPALMVRIAEQELRTRGRRVARLVVVGLGYNSLWERGRRRYRLWAGRFDSEALRLLKTLRRLGARQFVWVTLREPTPRTVPPSARGELGQYSWYFPYVNERLGRLDRRRDDLVLADWARASAKPGLTYDSIHLNTRGAGLMARTIWRAVSRAARRTARPGPSQSSSAIRSAARAAPSVSTGR